jgi:hypothetical protein
MANFSTANLLTAQTILNDRYAAPEMRMKPSPAFSMLLGNSNFLTVGAETLKTRDDRPIEAHLLARTKRTPGSARAYNHTGTIDDSQKVTLTWQTKSDVTAISIKLLDKSVLDFNTVLANKLEQCMMNIVESYETATIAYLLANRTQISASLKGGAAFVGTPNFAVEINADNKNKFYQVLKSVMRQNKYSSQLDIIADSNLFLNAEYLASQGAGNSSNFAFQFSGMNIRESIELADANYSNGVVIAMPSQSVGALSWIPKQNRQGYGNYNDYVGGYGVMRDPWGLGLQFALHSYQLRADTSATNGDVQDVLQQFELSLDISYNAAPLSGGLSESVIYEMAQIG